MSPAPVRFWFPNIDAIRVEPQAGRRLELIGPRELLGISLEFLFGDADATRLVGDIAQSREWIANHPARCVCCPRSLRLSPVIHYGFITEQSPERQVVLSFAACGRCSERPDLLSRVIRALRQVWPDSSPLAAGHAAPTVLQ